MNLWNQLESKKLTREELPLTLFKKLGKPKSELQTNLAQELIKKIVSYYFTSESELNHTIHSVVGTVQEIVHKRFKEGPQKGQSYYVLVLGESKETRSDRDGFPTKLQAKKELLKEVQWTQITKLGLLGQNLVFQYRKWITNKQVLGWYPMGKTKSK